MISTQDGHNLSVDDECFVLEFEESGEHIESSIRCIYKGFKVRDNRPFKTSVDAGASGCLPDVETIHHFESISGDGNHFSLLEHRVNDIVIKHLSAIETVIKRKLK